MSSHSSAKQLLTPSKSKSLSGNLCGSSEKRIIEAIREEGEKTREFQRAANDKTEALLTLIVQGQTLIVQGQKEMTAVLKASFCPDK